jgi:hypothetical protein
MPLHANLLPAMQVRPFGVEERIRTSRVEGRLRIDCAPGDKPAGVLLAGPWYLPRADAALQLAFSGSGSFRWQAADSELAARDGALELGNIDASGMPGSARLPLPSGLDRSSWRQFAIVCPDQAATLELESLALAPGHGKEPRRSAWVWRPGDWAKPSALLDWAHRTHVGELFIVVPTTGARVREAGALATFVRKARRAGVEVWTVDGDPRMVLPSERAATVARARAYAAYNAGVDAAARLAGMQFDVEPYLLPGIDTAAEDWDRRYLELATALHQAAGTLRLEFVVPYWWSRKDALLRALAAHADGLCVMDYRTAPDEIYRFAVPFLDWAEQYGKRTRIALEAGAVAPEVQRRYQRLDAGAAGNLALVRVEGQPVLVLLREAQVVPDSEAFRLTSAREIDGSATTFHGRNRQLLRLLPQIEHDFSAWRGFAGIALHELWPSTGRIQP